MICPYCEKENQDDGRFCVYCGQPLHLAPPTTDIRPTAPLEETPSPPQIEDRTPPPQTDDVGLDVEELSLAFEPLGEGTFLSHGRYFIEQPLESSQPQTNAYFAQDLDANDTLVLIKESDQWSLLGMELEIGLRQLEGDGLRPPSDAFQQEIGVPRYFVVLPPPGGHLGDVSLPVEVPQVINWGADLASGLAVLHQQEIAFGRMDPRRIYLEDNDAFLADFSSCVLHAPTTRFSDEIHQLAMMLFRLMTGKAQYDPQAALPANVKALFAQVLTGQTVMDAAGFASALEQAAGQIRRPEGVDLRVGRKTDVGKRRQLNEDSLCVLELVSNNQSINQPLGLYVIADGMGGHEGGEIASGLTINSIAQQAVQDLLLPATSGKELPDLPQWLVTAVMAANTAVYEKGKLSNNDMGTTVVAALVNDNEAFIAHVGDSRAYLVGPARIEQITTDHSLVERLIATGQITREEARDHPQGNVIYRTIGDREQIDVDINAIQLVAGDCLLLCSDGLSGMITDETIHNLVTSAASPQDACQALIQAANTADGEDNITVIIIKPEAVD